MGLDIKEDKSTYVVTTRDDFKMDRYRFEEVEEFKYLGSMITSKYNISIALNGIVNSVNTK